MVTTPARRAPQRHTDAYLAGAPRCGEGQRSIETDGRYQQRATGKE
jgi:hypothetical protein